MADRKNTTVEIPLTQGKVALVDAQDAERVSTRSWCARKRKGTDKWYALSGAGLLHRFILSPPSDKEVDHKNGNGLDCRRENMRLATHAQNVHNTRLSKYNKTGFKGVFYIQRKHGQKRWTVTIKNQYIGSFASPEEAARVYDAKARELFVEFAWLNFPDAIS